VSFPLNSHNDDRPQGKLPPELLQFNQSIRRNKVVPKVRAWVLAVTRAHGVNAYQVTDRIISEARVRITQFHEQPSDALALSAVLNTVIYRDNSMDFLPLVAQAKEAFASRL
jgi:PIN domain nuclease of toxin-antitoxin system